MTEDIHKELHAPRYVGYGNAENIPKFSLLHFLLTHSSKTRFGECMRDFCRSDQANNDIVSVKNSRRQKLNLRIVTGYTQAWSSGFEHYEIAIILTIH